MKNYWLDKKDESRPMMVIDISDIKTNPIFVIGHNPNIVLRYVNSISLGDSNECISIDLSCLSSETCLSADEAK